MNSNTLEAMLGVAGCRGYFWAADVARLVGVEQAWPEFEGKARVIALRKVSDIAHDESREELARACWESAAEAWAGFRAGEPVPGPAR